MYFSPRKAELAAFDDVGFDDWNDDFEGQHHDGFDDWSGGCDNQLSPDRSTAVQNDTEDCDEDFMGLDSIFEFDKYLSDWPANR